MAIPCPGRCNGDSTSGETIWGEPVWCSRDALIVRRSLLAMPKAYEALDSLLHTQKSVQYDITRVTGSHPKRSPGIGVDLRDEIYHKLRAWEEEVRRFLQHPGGTDGPSREATITRSVHYIDRHLDRVIQDPSGGSFFGAAILKTFFRALVAVKNGPVVHLLRVPCPYCNMRAMMLQEGFARDPWFTVCDRRLGGCGQLFNEIEVEWLVHSKLIQQGIHL